MPELVPSLEQINHFIPQLTEGERALMEALCQALDDSWTIYVQPFLNGLKPDIIIFSEQSGLAVFEVKDWNLQNYKVDKDGKWQVCSEGQWQQLQDICPFQQIKAYTNSIRQYELPELQVEAMLDVRAYALVAPFIYFHNHSTKEVYQTVSPLLEKHKYVYFFGNDFLSPDKLKKFIYSHLHTPSRWTEQLQRYKLQHRLRNILASPKNGNVSVSDILYNLSAQQKRLLSNAPGKKRVVGAAGSGKSLLLVRKAVNAAISGQKVLLVCYNITMVNYLNDLVRRLARYKDHGQKRIERNIYVRHYHRIFPGEDSQGYLDPEIDYESPFDVILIDEGQDFKREWIEDLYTLAHENSHIMLMEDDRQNLYGIDVTERRKVPGISGRPNVLKLSYRINKPVASLANALIQKSSSQFESEDVVPVTNPQMEMFPLPKPVWYNGSYDDMLNAMIEEVSRLLHTPGTGSPNDIVLLVCNHSDGWNICDKLDEINLPYVCTFASREEVQKLQHMKSYLTKKELSEEIEKLHRPKKMAFQMQQGSIKISTIQSFKGWELSRVFVFFNPTNVKRLKKAPLLYTAVTRAQEYLTIFNADETIYFLGPELQEDGVVEYRESILEPA